MLFCILKIKWKSILRFFFPYVYLENTVTRNNVDIKLPLMNDWKIFSHFIANKQEQKENITSLSRNKRITLDLSIVQFYVNTLHDIRERKKQNLLFFISFKTFVNSTNYKNKYAA